MKRNGAHFWVVLTAAVVGGCPQPPPEPVVVELSNITSLDVRPEFFASSSATDAGGLFIAGNRVTNFTDRAFPELRPGETRSLTIECDELSVMGVRGAVLFDSISLTTRTSADEIFLNRGGGFDCGETIRLVYFTEGDVFRVRVDRP